MGLTQFGKELSNDVLEKLSAGDLSPVSQLILELKQEIETKDHLLYEKEQNFTRKENELINLQKKLDEEKIVNNQMCKNQQTTIYNLREVLEATTKRNGNNNVSVSQLKSSSITNSGSTTTTVSGQQQVGQQNNNNTNNTTSSMWNWWRNVHDV